MEPANVAAARRVRRARALLPWAVGLGFGALLDQLTKQWAEQHVRPHGVVTVIPELFDLRYVRNPGAFFSLGGELPAEPRRVLLVAASVLVLALIAAGYRRAATLQRWGLSLLAGGALGNLIDRARSGEVVDFLYLHVGSLLHWATFNVADVAIVAGLAVLAWDALRPRLAGALASEAGGAHRSGPAEHGGT